jgi:2-deoxy-D-gluconate 3-dehydrogenase
MEMTDANLAMFDLSGKVALVTGCRQGIGLAMAQALAGAGADIVGVDYRGFSADDGSEAQERIEGAGRAFTGLLADLSDRSSVESLLATLAREVPRVDILVNNAGTIARAPAAEHPTEDWDRVLAVNLTAPFLLTRELGRAMVARGAGKIIFTASMLSFQGGILVPGYTASKSGVAGLVRAFANEWAAKGVNVNAVAPGYIATDNTAALRADADRSSAILARIPAGRWGEASDIGGATVFLAAPASDYVNGAIIPIDGGWMAR